MNNRLIVILGPTASGKTQKAVALARSIKGEIISADSRQLYKRMDIGTGKDLEDYNGVPYHMIDICEPGYKYNLYEYLRDANACLEQLEQQHVPAIVCGGTGLYIESLLNGLQLPEVPENKKLRQALENKSLTELTQILSGMKTLHNTTDIDTAKRAIRAIEIQVYYKEHPEVQMSLTPQRNRPALIIGLDIDRDTRRHRITERLNKRLQDGMAEEIRRLLSEGIPAEDLEYYGLEYKFVTQYVSGKITFEEMKNRLEIAIHQFAKRQMTWFRGMERRGFKIHWFPYDMPDSEFVGTVQRMLGQ